MAETRTHWKTLINPEYIGSYMVQTDTVIEIEKVVRELVTGTGGKKEECTVAYLKGTKPFILNRTNQKMITKLLKSPYIEDWAGNRITVYSTTTSVAGETTECLRVRPILPKEVDNTPFIAAEIEKIKACKTITELQTCYTSLQFKADNKVIAEKDKMKTLLNTPAQ